MDNGLGNLPKAVQVMVVVLGKVGGKLMQIALVNTLGDPEDLFPDRRMRLCLPCTRRRARPHRSGFVPLFCVRFHDAIITRASGRGKERLPAPSPLMIRSKVGRTARANFVSKVSS